MQSFMVIISSLNLSALPAADRQTGQVGFAKTNHAYELGGVFYGYKNLAC
jgi:hypothetical protein